MKVIEVLKLPFCVLGIHDWVYSGPDTFTAKQKADFYNEMLDRMGYELNERICKKCLLIQHFKSQEHAFDHKTGWRRGMAPIKSR